MILSRETLVKEHVNETQQLERKRVVTTVDSLLNGVHERGLFKHQH